VRIEDKKTLKTGAEKGCAIGREGARCEEGKRRGPMSLAIRRVEPKSLGLYKTLIGPKVREIWKRKRGGNGGGMGLLTR